MSTTTQAEALGTATYSPEDNKLRFYPGARLGKEDYERARLAGFSWAPKQELFVAPMWTPAREDLMIEWCGEIGDEDKSLVERAEERADRFEDYRDKRKADAESAHAAVASITDGIPLGQPILVGHHSERRARKDAERIENGMRRAVRMWDQAEYWKRRARGCISAAKYKERPDVRARRIKTIEAAQRKEERYWDEHAKHARFWLGQMKLKNTKTGETFNLEICQENIEWIMKYLGNDSCHMSFSFPLDKYPRSAPCSQYEGQQSLWSALGGSDGPSHAFITIEQAKELALGVCERVADNSARWIAHYENRLAYERAMLEADGGTVADKTGPEKGGACRCWASSRGGWSYIQKVNKVSVTILDNWGNGRANFTRVIPFDKLHAVMTAAEVQAARDCGILVELGDKTGFVLRGNGNDGQAERAMPSTPDAAAKDFDAMRQTLKAGVQVVSAPQLFPTPPDLAKRMVEIAEIELGQRVLEPSVGTGNLWEAIRATQHGEIVGVEINRSLAERISALGWDVRCADFLTLNGELGKFDRIVMNPPFANGQDIAHIKHALTMLKPGGRLVALCANGPKQREELEPLTEQWIDLEPGTFKESGTMVNAAMVVINGEAA